MASSFEVVVEEFLTDTEIIRSLVAAFDTSQAAQARIASANAATLLVAATFEEFIREMAREYARGVVASMQSFDRLPPKLAATAWKRTMESLARIKPDSTSSVGSEHQFVSAHTRFTVVHDFCKGDLTQDIYRDLIHNENNMRPNEINSMFKVSGLSDVCEKVSHAPSILEFLGETEIGKANARLRDSLEDFFERRNAIAHSLKRGQSDGPLQIINDISLLQTFARSLLNCLAPAAGDAAIQSDVPEATSSQLA